MKKILTALITLIVFAIIISIFWIIISFIMHLVADNHTFNLWSVRTFFISIAALFVSLGIAHILKNTEPPPPIVEKPKKVVKISKFQQRLEEMQREKNKNKNKK